MSSPLPSASTKLRWGLLGAGNIARAFARGLRESRLGTLTAVGSRESARAQEFLHAVEIDATAHGSYEALLADQEVNAIYIATPHPQHVEWCVRAAEAGKHVLVEKPIALHHAGAMVAIEAAREAGVALMEAWMYRCHPQTARVAELVRSGALGQVGLVQATFSFRSEFRPAHRLWANELGGGGILDVGGYPVSYARLIAGAMDGRPFLDPERVKAVGRRHPQTGVDVVAAATLEFPNGLLAQVSSGVGLAQENVVRIFGSDGWLLLRTPYVVQRDASPLLLHRPGREPEAITTPADRDLYAYEADAFAAAVLAGNLEIPACFPDDTLGNMRVLDAWRREIGLVYEEEQPANFRHTHKRRPLSRRNDAPIPRGAVEGLGKPVSRLVIGCDNQRTMADSAAMWDDYFERGGSAFDTAWLYHGGLMETLLGQWMELRGVRDDVVVIGKGAHTPHCNPASIHRQLDESLQRLRTSHVDVYFLHRDNPAVPVAEFVDALDAEVRAGRIRVFGGSNWTAERVDEANAYAARAGRHGFRALSNNFSLARMIAPVWSGCVAASEDAFREWLIARQLALFPWSSQARGFFTDRATARNPDPELTRCWFSEDNFRRRERALILAREKGVTPVAIAAAYVLAQPFPTFALIGPRTISETRGSIAAVNLTLSAVEVDWLDLRRPER